MIFHEGYFLVSSVRKVIQSRKLFSESHSGVHEHVHSPSGRQKTTHSNSNSNQVYYEAHFRGTTSNAPGPSVHLGMHSVTCNPHAYSHWEKFEPYYHTVFLSGHPLYTSCSSIYLPRRDGRLSQPVRPGDRTRAPLRGERSRLPLNRLS
jgi:hypothetical protein